MDARKITFQEAWDSTSIFFVDEGLEAEIDQEVDNLLEIARDPRISEDVTIEIDAIITFLNRNNNGLDVILRDIELSEEKFLRIVTLLRKINRIEGGFSENDTEWTLSRIKNKIQRDSGFALSIAKLLVNGKNDAELSHYIPRYYLDTLNYQEIRGGSLAARRVRYKRSLIGTYGGRKGYRVEGKIQQKLEELNGRYGIPFNKGSSRLIDTDIDFAIPSVDDPWVIIMSSFQETTSSGQTTKARDMFNAYIKVVQNNSRNREDRAFVNFVDGGGWLARKRDFERLVDQCHYFINLNYLEMLDAIVLKHVPKKYFGSGLEFSHDA
jgi:hypothetical protein